MDRPSSALLLSPVTLVGGHYRDLSFGCLLAGFAVRIEDGAGLGRFRAVTAADQVDAFVAGARFDRGLLRAGGADGA